MSLTICSLVDRIIDGGGDADSNLVMGSLVGDIALPAVSFVVAVELTGGVGAVDAIIGGVGG